MTNAEWIISQGIRFFDLDYEMEDASWKKIQIVVWPDYKSKPDKILDVIPRKKFKQENAYVLEWLDMERKEDVLDNPEKNYLRKVLKPLKLGNCEVIKIKRESGLWEYIEIVYTQRGVTKAIALPEFPTGMMYKGMPVSKHYTPEELGLWEKKS